MTDGTGREFWEFISRTTRKRRKSLNQRFPQHNTTSWTVLHVVTVGGSPPRENLGIGTSGCCLLVSGNIRVLGIFHQTTSAESKAHKQKVTMCTCLEE